VRRGLLPRAVGALLAALGDAVLVVEDVHRADPATLGLLHHLMGAMPPRLRLVVTEDAAPGLPVLGVRAPGRVRVEEIGVRPWTPEETGEFVRRWLGARRPERMEEHQDVTVLVHELTGGLPGVAGALLRAAGETLRAGEGGGPRAGSVLAAVREAGVPPRVRREWARRCAPLTEDARRIVEAAAGGVQEVIEVYRHLGARWDVARCQRLLRRHDIVTTHRRGRLGYGDRLSPRE
jgi:hypothetical protein